MTYHLWDVATQFYFGQFDNEREPLSLVRSLLDRYGLSYADDLELVIGDDTTQNLTGHPLAERAYAPTLPPPITRALAR